MPWIERFDSPVPRRRRCPIHTVYYNTLQHVLSPCNAMIKIIFLIACMQQFHGRRVRRRAAARAHNFIYIYFIACFDILRYFTYFNILRYHKYYILIS